MQSAAASSNYLFVRIAEKAVQVIVEALELRWLITRGLFLGILGSIGRDKLAQLLRAHLLAVVILRSGGFRGLVLRLRTARASVGGTVPSGIRMSAALRGLPVPAARLCLSLSRNAEPGALKDTQPLFLSPRHRSNSSRYPRCPVSRSGRYVSRSEALYRA